MGNVCCNYDKIDPAPKGDRPGFPNRLQPEAESLAKKEVVDPHNVSVLDQIGRVAIEALLKEAEEALAADPVPNPKNALVTEKFKLFNSDYNFWANFSDLQGGNKLHHYSHRLDYPFTPELYFLFSLQQSLESFSKIDDSLEQLEILNFQADGDLVIKITRTRTKKILVIEPRSFVVLSVVKRVSKDRIIEAQRSVQLTGLAEQEPWKSILAQQVNLAEFKLGANLVEFDGTNTILRSKADVDILSSTGPTILKMALKGKFSRYYKNLVREALWFITRSNPAQYRNFIWFTNAPEEFTRILEENRAIVAQKNPNLTELDQSEKDEVTNSIRSHSSNSRKGSEYQEKSDSLIVPKESQERRTSQPVPVIHHIDVTAESPHLQPVNPNTIRVEGRTDSTSFELKAEDISPPKAMEGIQEPAKLVVPVSVKVTDMSPQASPRNSGMEGKKPIEVLDTSHALLTTTPASWDKPLEANVAHTQAPDNEGQLAQLTPVPLPDTNEAPQLNIPTLEQAKEFSETQTYDTATPIYSTNTIATPAETQSLDTPASTQWTINSGTTQPEEPEAPADEKADTPPTQGGDKKKKKKKKGN
jgi:hypothetical protein